jgi:tripartite ATP-independent transporter DctM subunit
MALFIESWNLHHYTDFITASMFGWLLAYLKVPALVTSALLGVSSNPIVVLLLINIMCLVLGCIMDMGPLILILTPILLPIVTGIGMDPVQFGAMLILNLAIGLCTPPVGAALFAGCSIGKIKIEDATKASLPFYAVMIIVLLLITFIPSISLFVPKTFL